MLKTTTLVVLIGAALAVTTTKAQTYIGISCTTPVGMNGAEVTGLKPGSPALKAGIQQGDVIVRFNGMLVDSAQQLSGFIKFYAPVEKPVTLEIRRGNQLMTVIVQPPQGDIVTAGKSSVAENCAKGAGSAIGATVIVTTLMCVADLFFSGGALCTTYVTAAAAHAPVAVAAGCAVGGITGSGTAGAGQGIPNYSNQ